MTNGNDRLDRIERILEEVAKRQREMAARQQYHDEAHERHDAEIKAIREISAANTESIRILVRISELHHQRLNRLEDEDQA